MEVVDTAGDVTHVRLPVRLPQGKHYFLEEVNEGNFLAHNALLVPRDLFRRIGGWNESIAAWEHDDVLICLNPVSSIQGVREVTYRKTAHPGPQLSKNMLALAGGLKSTWEKHRRLFALHPRREASYLAAMGIYYLKDERWEPAVRATTRALARKPRSARVLRYWVASLAAPGSFASTEQSGTTLARKTHHHLRR